MPRVFTKEPPFGFMDQRKKTTPINPIPKASLKYILDDSILIEDPEMIVFVPYWISDLGLNYTTQYFDNNRWNSLSIRNGTGGLMYNYTVVNYLNWGVARVITKEFVEQFQVDTQEVIKKELVPKKVKSLVEHRVFRSYIMW